VVTSNPQAAAWYRRAQRAADPRRAAMALRLAVTADPDFALAAADLDAITAADLEAIAGTSSHRPGRRPMNWERHHIEVVAAAAAGHVTRASDLLREHLASVGCDPLALRITAGLRKSMARDDDLDELVTQLPGCHATPWPGGPWGGLTRWLDRDRATSAPSGAGVA
jgi:hypothetical protein